MQGASSADRLLCAHCQGHGKLACKGCLLVLYCGADCQKAHWGVHKADCKSPLIKDTWKPQWDLEDRQPAFIGGSGQKVFGGTKFFWGNVPAIDVLCMARNEGAGYDKDVRLLFAASGDARNVIKTITSMPKDHGETVHTRINDRDFDIVARNAIILLIALTIEDISQAVECMIHVRWTWMDMDVLRDRIRPLIEDVCTKVAGKTSGTMLGKTWTFGKASLRLVLTKEQWPALLAYFETPEDLSPERAQRIRTNVTLADSRRDYRERRMIGQVPAHRVCHNRFRDDGILLLFGHHRNPHIAPNPTIYQTADWPMKDSADPLDGWALEDVLRVDTGPATNDVYGKLFYYLKELFSSFHGRLSALKVSFELSNHAAEELHNNLKTGAFARIEAANISDAGYLGCARTVASLGPLLESTNPHATLLTLFMNAVDEMCSSTELAASTRTELTGLMKYLPLVGVPPRSVNDSRAILMNFSRPIVRDVDKYFDRHVSITALGLLLTLTSCRYMEGHNFKAVEQYFDMRIKNPHTIIEKWPIALKLRPGQKGAQEEFNLLLSSSHTGNERRGGTDSVVI
ncbi:hypothetical protein LTR85_003999 [Meristemomyces frigidus]|nr:hypothetical protein LTR85_003999 [Meristemomyces frigidus]